MNPNLIIDRHRLHHLRSVMNAAKAAHLAAKTEKTTVEAELRNIDAKLNSSAPYVMDQDIQARLEAEADGLRRRRKALAQDWETAVAKCDGTSEILRSSQHLFSECEKFLGEQHV